MNQEINLPRVRRCAFYLRVSEDDGNKEGNSIEAQRAACQSYVTYQNANGFPVEVVDEFVELGKSGKDLERPKVKELLALARAKAIDTIIVYKLDRLSRSLLDFCRLAEDFKKDQIELVSTTQNLDSSTSHGRLMINILMTFAQYERELIQERTQSTMRTRARDGKWNGSWIPYGFDRTPSKTLVPNTDERKYVVKIFDWILVGDSPERVALKLKNEGVKRKLRFIQRKGSVEKKPSRPRFFDSSDIRRLVQRPEYAGLVRSGRNLFPSRHEALISRETWEKANAFIAASKPSRAGVVQTKHDYLLNGILQCGCCDSSMTGYRVGKSGPHYYACQRHRRGDGEHRCSIGNLRVPMLDDFAVRLLGEVARLPELVDAFVHLAKQEQQKLEDTQRDLNTVVAALEASRDQKGRIKEEIKAALSGVSRKEWRAELDKILMQEKALQEEMETLTQRLRDESADADLRQQIKAALGNAGEFVQSLSKEARDQFLRATIRKMVVNVPQTESVKNGVEVLTFQPPVEKGRYLVNVEFRESSLASMLSMHCAEHSINIDSWLPGKGSNL